MAWRPEFLKPCGTEAAYRRHLRRGEPVDDACRAEARYMARTRKRARNARRKAARRAG